jgi:hypothetical protein
MIGSIKDAAIIRGTGRGDAGQALAYGPHDLIYVPILVLTKARRKNKRIELRVKARASN